MSAIPSRPPDKQMAAIVALEACSGYSFILEEVENEILTRSEKALSLATPPDETFRLKLEINLLKEMRDFLPRRKSVLQAALAKTLPIPQK